MITRNALGGCALTFFCPQLLLILGIVTLKLAGVHDPVIEGRIILSYALAVGLLYPSLTYLAGWRLFERLEDAAPIRRDLALPDSWSRYFASLATRLLPEKRGIMTSLICKELRLQQPAFATAAVLVGIWLAFFGVWVFRPAIGSALMVVPPFVLYLVIPILSGCVSTAEERSLGIHDWHLTLPVTARRQWFVKVLAALSLNVVLGLLLPWLLLLVTSPLANTPGEFLFVSGTRLVSIFISFGFLAAALYASTAVRDTLRAILGTIVLCIVIPLMFSLSKELIYQCFEWHLQMNIHRSSVGLEYAFRYAPFYCVSALVCLVGLFCAIGLANFKYSLGLLRLPIQRLLLLFSVTWLFVNIDCAQMILQFVRFHIFGR